MSEPDPTKFQFGMKGMITFVTLTGALVGGIRLLYLEAGVEIAIGVAVFSILLAGGTTGGALVGFLQTRGSRHGTHQGAIEGLLIGILLMILLLCLFSASVR